MSPARGEAAEWTARLPASGRTSFLVRRNDEELFFAWVVMAWRRRLAVWVWALVLTAGFMAAPQTAANHEGEETCVLDDADLNRTTSASASM